MLFWIREIIEGQFAYLFEKKDSNYGLKKVRDVMGGQLVYPAIECFETVIQEKKRKKLINKGNII